MYKITKKRVLAPNITRFSVEAPEVARSRKPGQFVVIRADETSERVPLKFRGDPLLPFPFP